MKHLFIEITGHSMAGKTVLGKWLAYELRQMGHEVELHDRLFKMRVQEPHILPSEKRAIRIDIANNPIGRKSLWRWFKRNK